MKKVLGRLRRPTRHPATQLTQMSLPVESLVKNMISEISTTPAPGVQMARVR